MASFCVKVELFAAILIFAIACLWAQTSHATPTPRRSRASTKKAPAPRICSFNSAGTVYSIADLLRCMNDLAAGLALGENRQAGRSADLDYYFGSRRQNFDDYGDYYGSRPGDRPPYYGRPVDPALYESSAPGYYGSQGFGEYPNQGLGYEGPSPVASLYNALMSVAQYDDLKCVPRLLCEVATGSKPGSYYGKQSSSLSELGQNALVGLLTAFDVSESNPLLGFAKSALLGYSSRGDSSVCYREYVKCPRNPNDLVYYLNNHNGGFFRFFSNVGRSDAEAEVSRGFHRASRVKPAPPPGLSGPESDRTGTGELKFDNPPPSARLDYETGTSQPPNRSSKLIFPEDDRSLEEQGTSNRVSKSLFDNSPGFFPDSSSKAVSNREHSFFPTDDGGTTFFGNQEDSVTRLASDDPSSSSGKVRLYVPEAEANESTTSFVFPDGQKVEINVRFAKVIAHESERTSGNEDSEQHLEPTSFEGYSMVNLADYFSEDPDLILKHPCDMVCHDSRGTLVQFNQVSSNDDDMLTTMMTPERPVLDLSRDIPCEVICLDQKGDEKQVSTILSNVLRPTKNHYRTNQISSHDPEH